MAGKAAGSVGFIKVISVSANADLSLSANNSTVSRVKSLRVLFPAACGVEWGYESLYT